MALSARSLIFGSFCVIAGIVLHHLFTTPAHLAAAATLARQRALHGPSTAWTPSPLSDATRNVTRQNATFVTLARNSDVWTLARSIQSVEDRFNRHWGYDWVFLNDEPFTAEFKDVTSSLVSGRVFYGQVPAAHWGYPEWINQTRAAEARQEARQKAVMYAASESYRHMCRFFSGFFFRHELLQGYEYYWRVEPETEYYCDIREDPFRVLKEEGKKYGFVISVREDPETINSLWGSVKRFIGKYPEHLAEGNSETWLSDDGGENYNGCHFWSNFEVGSLSWLRSQAYADFFNHFDHEGGFFYERWGDAPIHSIAAALLLKKEEIHFFNEIAYYHPPYTHCPTGEPLKRELKCSCNRAENVDWMDWSCLPRYYRLHELPAPGGYKEELPLIQEAMRLRYEDDAIARAEMFADAAQEQNGVLLEGAAKHSPVPGAGKEDAEIEKLRKANKTWKRMVRYLRQKEGLKELSKEKLSSSPEAGVDGANEIAETNVVPKKSQRVLSSAKDAGANVSEVQKLQQANKSWRRMVKYLMQKQGLKQPAD